MPTSLSLYDLSLRKDINPRESNSPRRYNRTNHERRKQILEEENCTKNVDEEIIADADEQRKDHSGSVELGQSVEALAGIPVPEMESEQIIVESEDNISERHIHQNTDEANDQHQDIDQNVNVVDADDEAGDAGFPTPLDLPLFGTSPMGVYEFSTEFLAIARRHRLQPKARAILLDLLQRTMPESNRCPQTIAEMRKLVACDERTHKGWFGPRQSAILPSTSVSKPQIIRPKSHYLLPTIAQHQPSSSHQLPSGSNKPINSIEDSIYCTPTNFESSYLDEECMAEEQVEEQIIDDQGMMYYQPEEFVPEAQLLVPHIFQTINRLNHEVAMLRDSLQVKNSHGTMRKVKRRSVFSDGQGGLHIYDTNQKRVLLNELDDEGLRNTIDISRNDEQQRLIYGPNDITEMVLDKLDLAPYLHNPSLCGRMVADVLFSPEYLADKHILAEGQVSSRARLELLPPEMTRLFYDSLRKLGVSRIAEDDQEHWLYLARDGVNQRARDLKANRKRKFYVDEQQPVFKEDQI